MTSPSAPAPRDAPDPSAPDARVRSDGAAERDADRGPEAPLGPETSLSRTAVAGLPAESGPERRTLAIVDVQNDFCEGGALAIEGGQAVAERIAEFLADHAEDYARVVASRDWHAPTGDNGSHFALPPAAPDFQDTWPPHCVQGTAGAAYHPAIQQALTRLEVRGLEVVHVVKGEGTPAYSLAEGRIADAEGGPAAGDLARLLTGPVDVVGLAFDHCVAASAQDLARWDPVGPTRVLADLTAAVHPEQDERTIARLAAAGVQVADAADDPLPGPAGYAAPSAGPDDDSAGTGAGGGLP